MAKANERPIAVFNQKNYRAIGAFILKVKTISLNIANHILIFATPVPPILTVDGDVVKLENAEALAETRVAGAAASRDSKYEVVNDEVHAWLNYVQSLADAAPDVNAAIAIIESSGFSVKVKGVHVKPPLEAQNGAASGQVKLIAKAAGDRASYDWQQSANGTDWDDLPSTLKASTSVNGLAVDAKLFFRFRSITATGTSAWSAAVGIRVV